MMAWPQITVASILALHLVCALALHGQPRGPWQFSDAALSAALWALLLLAGGFWK